MKFARPLKEGGGSKTGHQKLLGQYRKRMRVCVCVCSFARVCVCECLVWQAKSFSRINLARARERTKIFALTRGWLMHGHPFDALSAYPAHLCFPLSWCMFPFSAADSVTGGEKKYRAYVSEVLAGAWFAGAVVFGVPVLIGSSRTEMREDFPQTEAAKLPGPVCIWIGRWLWSARWKKFGVEGAACWSCCVGV